MKRRLLSISLALALCLTLLPTAAWADDGDTADGGVILPPGGGDTGGDTADGKENVEVNSWAGLIDAIEEEDVKSITLTQDVPREQGDDAITIPNDKDLTIYLNGHTLDGAGQGSVITVKDGGDLTIQNSSSDDPGTPGTITGGNAANGGGIYIEAGGTVTIQANVEITGNEATGTGDNGLGGGVYNAGTFTMNGGAIYGNSAGEAAADFYNAPGGKFTLALADGYDWYEDKPDKRYTGTQTPCTNPETGSEAEEATYLAAEVPLTWDTVGEDTVFMIYDAAQLAAFRDIVNGSNGEGAGNPAADAKLMKDITIYEDLETLLDENGNPKDDSGLVSWEPIGTSQYFGTFDGNGYTISGLYCDISDDGFPYAGLFSSVNDDGSGNRGTVRNLNVADSFVSFSGNGAAGGICGQNHGAITGCTFSGRVQGSGSMSTVGGVCGFNNSTGTIENCWNTGAVTAAGSTSR